MDMESGVKGHQLVVSNSRLNLSDLCDPTAMVCTLAKFFENDCTFTP